MKQQAKTLKSKLKEIGAADWITGGTPKVNIDRTGIAQSVVKTLNSDQATVLREDLETVKLWDNEYSNTTHIQL